ncbi:MAG: hypothetical protein ACK50D_13890, partial [Burkholderiales bacterium]
MRAKLIAAEHLALVGDWQVVWFGPLVRQNTLAGNVYIKIFLRKLAAPSRSLQTAQVYASPEIQSAMLPVALLMEFPIGTVISSGMIKRVDTLDSEGIGTKRELEPDFSKKNVTFFKRSETDPISKTPIIDPSLPIPEDPDFLDAWCIGIKIDDDPFALVLPCVECFRFFCCVSSTLANAFVDGKFAEPSRYIYGPEAPRLDRATRTAYIRLQREMLSDDVQHIFRFSVGEGRKVAAELTEFLAAQEPIGRRFLATRPPIDGPMSVKAFVLSQLRPDGRRRLEITKLIACGLEPLYSTLHYFHEQNKGGAPLNGLSLQGAESQSGYSLTRDSASKIIAAKNSARAKGTATRVQAHDVDSRFPRYKSAKIYAISAERGSGAKTSKKVGVREREYGAGSTTDSVADPDVLGMIISAKHDLDQLGQVELQADEQDMKNDHLNVLIGVLSEIAKLKGVSVEFPIVAKDYVSLPGGVNL